MNRIACCLLVFMFLMRFFYVQDPYFICTFLLVICLTVCLTRQMIKLTIIDLCLLLLWAYIGIGPTVNFAGSAYSFITLTSNILYYFLLRYIITYDKKGEQVLLSSFTVCIAVLSALAFYSFYLFCVSVDEMGFSSLYDFRFLYKPLGVPNNEWSSLQWLFGGIITAVYIYSENKITKGIALLSGAIILCLALVSFSRGIYLAGIVFIILLIVLERRKLFERKKIIIGGGYCLLVLVVVCLYSTEIKKTLHGNETVSQQRSTKSRINTFQLTTDVLKEYPFGVGLNNYTLAKDYYLHGEKRVDSYTSYAANSFLKIGIEGGYAGLIFYILFLLSIVYYLVKAKKRNLWLLFLFLFAFFLREQTFSTFFDSSSVRLSALILIAFLQKEEIVIVQRSNIKILAAIPCLAWICVFYIFRFNCNVNHDVARLVNQSMAYRKVNIPKALTCIKQAQLKNPLDVHLAYYEYCWSEKENAVHNEDKLRKMTELYPDKLLFQWTLYEQYKQQHQLENAATELRSCILQNPRILGTSFWKELNEQEPGFAELVVGGLLKEKQEKPLNVIELAKWGSIALQLGKNDLALSYLNEVSKQLPNLSRVWFNLASILEKEGKLEQASLYRQRGSIMELGVFSKDRSYMPSVEQDINKIINEQYSFLFNLWYNENLKNEIE